MLIFPAIDLYDGKVVRLLQGDYRKMTVYSEHPEEIAAQLAQLGAKCLHLVDLAGARDGTAPHMDVIRRIVSENDLFCEIGGGIRSFPVIEQYLNAGIGRVILGTIAVTDPEFVREAVRRFGSAVAVGADVRGDRISIHGWTEDSHVTLHQFAFSMQQAGVSTLICTDISRDGAMIGANCALYRELSEKYNMQIIASGGVSTLDDLQTLSSFGLYGAIIGKAWYAGQLDLKKALEVAHGHQTNHPLP